MIIRCCGSLLIEEPPEKRTKLVQEMWQTLESLGKFESSLYAVLALLNIGPENYSNEKILTILDLLVVNYHALLTTTYL